LKQKTPSRAPNLKFEGKNVVGSAEFKISTTQNVKKSAQILNLRLKTLSAAPNLKFEVKNAGFAPKLKFQALETSSGDFNFKI
jgi:hypothetical protein